MIVDTIAQISRYSLPHKEKVLQFLQSFDPKSVPDGEHEIDGRRLFVRVMSYAPGPAQEKKFETHRIYADLQYVAEGVELMQIAPADQLKPVTDYDAKGDYRFFEAGNFVTDLVVRAGEFAVFYPGQAHKPGCLYGHYRRTVKKLVFKIKVA